jgi:hypothetical protein
MTSKTTLAFRDGENAYEGGTWEFAKKYSCRYKNPNLVKSFKDGWLMASRVAREQDEQCVIKLEKVEALVDALPEALQKYDCHNFCRAIIDLIEGDTQ